MALDLSPNTATIIHFDIYLFIYSFIYFTDVLRYNWENFSYTCNIAANTIVGEKGQSAGETEGYPQINGTSSYTKPKIKPKLTLIRSTSVLYI